MDVEAEEEEEVAAAPVEEELELNEESALRGVLRKVRLLVSPHPTHPPLAQGNPLTHPSSSLQALVHDGLQRGLHESAKALDRHSAKLCVLARDVDSDEYKTLVTALCKEGSVPLLYIDTREKLGEFVGLAKVRSRVPTPSNPRHGSSFLSHPRPTPPIHMDCSSSYQRIRPHPSPTNTHPPSPPFSPKNSWTRKAPPVGRCRSARWRW